MDCEQVQERISRLLDGDLNKGEEAAVRAHLQTCADCRRVYTALAAFSEALRGDQAEPPAALHENVMAALRREEIRKRHTRLRRALLSAAAVLALVVALRAVLPPLHADRTLGAAMQLSLSEAAVQPTTLDALLRYLDGTALPEGAPEGDALTTLTLPDGVLTLYEHGGALRYRDPASGALLETARSLEEIESFLAE